jgi:hypothetical protein
LIGREVSAAAAKATQFGKQAWNAMTKSAAPGQAKKPSKAQNPNPGDPPQREDTPIISNLSAPCAVCNTVDHITAACPLVTKARKLQKKKAKKTKDPSAAPPLHPQKDSTIQ